MFDWFVSRILLGSLLLAAVDWLAKRPVAIIYKSWREGRVSIGQALRALF